MPPEAAAEAVVETPPPESRRWMPKLNLPRFWGITDIVGISDSAWGKVSWIAAGVGVVAILVNFGMVVAYAAGVAMDAPLIPNEKGWLAVSVNFVIGIGQVAVAGMLQLGTDFCLLFAAGLAKSKYKFTPTAALILWAICAANTLEMKKDIYESIRDGRIIEAQIAEEAKAPATVVKARAALLLYADKPAPPEKAASEALMDGADASIRDLSAEREEKVQARSEEARTGRQSRWGEHDRRIAEIDALLRVERDKLSAARVAIAEREAFDASTKAVTDWENRPKIEKSPTGYDSGWAIGLRVWGLSLLSFISILVAFAADKAADDLRKIEAEKARRSNAAYKAADTRAQKRNTKDADFSEAAPLDSRALPHDPHVQDGTVSKADTRTQGTRAHPDKAGDDFGAKASGYEGVTDGTGESGQPEDQH